MRLIDGAHRLRAAIIKGETHIAACLFRGSPDEAFIEAVRLNTTHGKPLTLTDRELAAERILHTYGVWSDRAIAKVCGLSPKTVGSLRARLDLSTEERVGLDGRRRPARPAEQRLAIERHLATNPEDTDSKVARATGASPNTVRRVRRRTSVERRTPPPNQSSAPGLDWRAHDGISTDAALAATPEGRALASWLEEHDVSGTDWSRHVDAVPLSRAHLLIDMAVANANGWEQFAAAIRARLERR
jgi:hypothetical protein